jgi:hypothetical protein
LDGSELRVSTQVRAVRHSAELGRIAAIPRREWADGAPDLAQVLTASLRTARGRMSLFPIQASALKESWENQGFFGPIGVGRGKTLISLLLPFVLESKRPLLVLPTKLIEKTKREQRELSVQWKIPNWVRIESYEYFSSVKNKFELERFAPDLIVFDEVHKLKDKKAARTKRFARYVAARRSEELAANTNGGRVVPLRVCAMSGTITSKSIRDFAHIVQWCIPRHSPVPWVWTDLEEWCYALDEIQNEGQRYDPGALLAFCTAEENGLDPTQAARRGFARRLHQTPGVVSTGDVDSNLGASIQISELESPASAAIDAAFVDLRKAWTLPDGWPLVDGAAVAQKARELALGFYYIWDPRPPVKWLEARYGFNVFIREKIKAGCGDSMLDVCQHFPNADEIRHWKQVEPTFKPNQQPVWICDSAVRACAEWLGQHPKGICWVDHVAFGDRLEQYTGIPYFRQQARDKRGKYIEDASGPIIASIDSCRDGLNLQHKWSDNLISSSPSDGLAWEQLMARTHRLGQKEDEVSFEVLNGCAEDLAAFWRAYSRSQYEQEIQRQPQKLCYADLTLRRPEDMIGRGSRFQK